MKERESCNAALVMLADRCSKREYLECVQDSEEIRCNNADIQRLARKFVTKLQTVIKMKGTREHPGLRVKTINEQMRPLQAWIPPYHHLWTYFVADTWFKQKETPPEWIHCTRNEAEVEVWKLIECEMQHDV